MNTTLTIRLPSEQRKALKRKAAALRLPESELVRGWIARELDDTPILVRVSRLVGGLDSRSVTRKPHPLKAVIKRNNWRK